MHKIMLVLQELTLQPEGKVSRQLYEEEQMLGETGQPRVGTELTEGLPAGSST